MPHAKSIAIALSMALLSACHRPVPASPVVAEPTPSPVVVKPLAPPTADEQAEMAALAGQGAQALAGLGSQQDVSNGATWFQGSVPAKGSTAYLYLGKLGEGATTLRFVVRYQGARPANLSTCTVAVDGAKVGSFWPAPNRVDQPAEGLRQLADIHFEDVRPIVLAMIKGQSAAIRTADDQEILLGRAELDEMRRVLSAYLHLQAQP